MADQYVRDHQAWLGYLQPDGLVVSPAALVDSQVILPRDAREEQQRFLEFVAEAPIGDDEHVEAIADLTQFLETFLEWPPELLHGANPARPLPETLCVPLSEFGEILSPTIAFADPKPKDPAQPWLLLVQSLSLDTDLDAAVSHDARGWSASPARRFERLLRETRVPIGLLALLRAVHGGCRHAQLAMPAREGYLFDPERFPFLEGHGRPYANRAIGTFSGAPPRVEEAPGLATVLLTGTAAAVPESISAPGLPLISDGVIWRVLQKLLMLGGERLSYRTLDVEQIGSVYETMMGFRLEVARGAFYLVGTPKGRLSRLEQQLSQCPWQQARPEVQVKLLPQEGELYVFVRSASRIHKERAIRRKKLKRLWARLKELQRQRPTYETLLLKLGAAKKEAGRVASLVRLSLPQPPTKKMRSQRVSFEFALNKARLRTVRRREGRYLLRSNLTATNPAKLWEFYLQLVEVEAAFKNLKSDLAIRPIHHQRDDRIEAHLFVSFLAYCVFVSLKHQLKAHAPGLTVRQALEKLAAMQMLDVHFPTTDGRELIFTRHTEPEPDQQLLLAKLGWILPPQAPPRVTTPAKIATEM